MLKFDVEVIFLRVEIHPKTTCLQVLTAPSGVQYSLHIASLCYEESDSVGGMIIVSISIATLDKLTHEKKLQRQFND